MKSNKPNRKKLEKEFGKKCMLTGIQDKMTFHHIIKREQGGADTTENGALLLTDIHQWLHASIELQDEPLYDLITECLILYKKVKSGKIKALIQLYEDECMPEFRKVVENDKIRRVNVKKRKS